MISSEMGEPTGQASLESLMALGLIIAAATAAALLILHGLGTVILTKWAAENSLCVARQNPLPDCERKTKSGLNDHFSFHRVAVRTRILRGIIHTEVEGVLAGGKSLLGRYDLEPSEYKRVSQ